MPGVAPPVSGKETGTNVSGNVQGASFFATPASSTICPPPTSPELLQLATNATQANATPERPSETVELICTVFNMNALLPAGPCKPAGARL